MKIRAPSMCIAVTGALLLVAASPLTSARDDKKTRLEVNEPIEIPGTVLQPGEYVIQLVDSQGNNHIVRFSNADETKTFATVLTVANKRMDPAGNTKFKFYETPSNKPPVLRSWFYPGDNYGHEFVYPELRASEISKYSHRHVPMTSGDTAGKEMTSASVVCYSADSGKSDLETGWKANWEADRRAFGTEGYLSAREEDESVLARRVRKELVTLPYYSVWDHFEFAIEGNEVTLMGKVHRPTLKTSAERVVKRIEEVESVKNQIEVLPVSPNDDRIRRSVYYAVYGQSALNRYQLRAVPPIHIIVENGDVTLEGVVANSADRQIAEMEANSVSGVFSVTNNLRIG